MTVDDATLVMYVTRVMLSTQREPKAKDLWGDFGTVNRTW